MLRRHLLDLLGGGRAHLDFDAAVAGLPARLRGATHPKLPHSPWQLVEHLRIAQWDILEFSRNPAHVSPPWPAGYWPKHRAPGRGEWQRGVAGFRRDLARMRRLVASPKTELLAPLPWASGASVAWQALLLADHNAYHVGQLILLRRLLDAWPQPNA
jgi:hypothetical protein